MPLLTLTSLSENGTFSSALANRVLTDAALQEKVIQSVTDVVKQNGYGGVDVDFEYIPQESAAAYANFVGAIREKLEQDYEVFVSAAPKASADQPGLLYGGHDYRLLGEAADMVLLMTYEWGYTFGPPMAVSPLPQVKRVLDYGVTEIPREKYSWAYQITAMTGLCHMSAEPQRQNRCRMLQPFIVPVSAMRRSDLTRPHNRRTIRITTVLHKLTAL